MPRDCLEGSRSTNTRRVLEHDDAGCDLAKCLRPDGFARCDENGVNAKLRLNSERGGFEAAMSAAGADNERCRVARRKGLRSHENPVIGRAVRAEIDLRGARRG